LPILLSRRNNLWFSLSPFRLKLFSHLLLLLSYYYTIHVSSSSSS
jgi:hypothetical protein